MPEILLIVDTLSSKSPLAEQVTQRQSPFRTMVVDNAEKAVQLLRNGAQPQPHALLLDVPLANETGLELIRSVRALKPQIPIIALTKYGDHDYAKQAMAAGASDYLTKPVELERLLYSLQQALKLQRMGQYVTWLERKVAGHMDLGDLVGKHPSFVSAMTLASEAAASKRPVWVIGQEGAGKASFARAIHGSSDRAGKPFVTVNCRMLPEAVAENILFGCENTAGDTPLHFALGKLREADQGTLLLASVEALPLHLQQRLVDVLNSGALIPQGGKNEIPIDVRLVCTSSAPLDANDVPEGVDPKLYRRLKTIIIPLPPLSKRADDVALLAEHFIAMYSTSENKFIRGLTPAALEWLTACPWPGNVHQLANTLWRAIVLCSGDMLDVSDVQNTEKNSNRGNGTMYEAGNGSSSLIDKSGRLKTLRSVEEEAIRFALEHAHGCMTQAARNLGIGRSTLYRKVSQFDMNRYISRANQTTRPMTTVSSTNRS